MFSKPDVGWIFFLTLLHMVKPKKQLSTDLLIPYHRPEYLVDVYLGVLVLMFPINDNVYGG